MGRGRKPKPTALKKLEGNPGKRPLNELEPVPPTVALRCPNYLLPEARKEWKRLAPILMGMGLLTAADAVPLCGILSGLCALAGGAGRNHPARLHL